MHALVPGPGYARRQLGVRPFPWWHVLRCRDVVPPTICTPFPSCRVPRHQIVVQTTIIAIISSTASPRYPGECLPSERGYRNIVTEPWNDLAQPIAHYDRLIARRWTATCVQRLLDRNPLTSSGLSPCIDCFISQNFRLV